MEKLTSIEFDWHTMWIIVGIIIGAMVASRVARYLIDRFFIQALINLEIDPTRFKFFKNAVSFIIWIIAIIAIVSLIHVLKTFALTLFAGAGILVAVMGFAAQKAFANVISGVVLIMFEPFKVGDTIRVGEIDFGIVEDITLRHTVINNLEGKHVIIPNSVMGEETIINETHANANVCRWIDFGISYDSDADKAIKIIQEVAMQHPSCVHHLSDNLDRLSQPKVIVRVLGYSDFSVDLRAYVWTNDPVNAVQMHSDINRQVKKRFDKEGIEIPFPYRTLVFKKDLQNFRTE